MLTEEFIINVYCLLDEMVKKVVKMASVNAVPLRNFRMRRLLLWKSLVNHLALTRKRKSAAISKITGFIIFQGSDTGRLSIANQQTFGA